MVNGACSDTVTSAGSRDLFCNRLFKMLNILAREIGADTPDEFCFAQKPIRFGDCPLGVNPLWLDSIQPRALDRQLADQDSHAPLTLGLPVMGANPRADFLAEVPTGVVGLWELPWYTTTSCVFINVRRLHNL